MQSRRPTNTTGNALQSFFTLFPNKTDLLKDLSISKSWSIFIKSIKPLVNRDDHVLFIGPLYPFLIVFSEIMPGIKVTWIPDGLYKSGNDREYEEKCPLKEYDKIVLDSECQYPSQTYKLIIARHSEHLSIELMTSLLGPDSTLMFKTTGNSNTTWRKNQRGVLEEVPFTFKTFNVDSSSSSGFNYLLDHDYLLLKISLEKHLKSFKASKEVKQSSTTLYEVAQDEAECIVCFMYLKAPIFTCSNGHNLCKPCRQAVESCPMCKVQIFVRNLSLEKILNALPQPCKGQNDGCKERLTVDVLEIHEENCRFTKLIKCNGCNMDVVVSNYINHIKQHEISVIDPLIHDIKISAADIHELNKFILIKSKTSEDIFQIEVKSVDNNIQYMVKLVGPEYHRLKYKVDMTVAAGASTFKFSKYLQLVEETNQPTVNIPTKSLRDSVQISSAIKEL